MKPLSLFAAFAAVAAAGTPTIRQADTAEDAARESNNALLDLAKKRCSDRGNNKNCLLAVSRCTAQFVKVFAKELFFTCVDVNEVCADRFVEDSVNPFGGSVDPCVKAAQKCIREKNMWNPPKDLAQLDKCLVEKRFNATSSNQE
ncbi:hypothetical protein MGU_09991 [Metarhizium guizhouense ARSEF 977]|uniref:Uncharacterized protein n=1 Tax=Metarhizium guizhouense (strain ARSEF 977) TaxID=1276136 RepID=A0A0B4GYW8_METGA|nr:hypothetical protein MGU_09991 [Metarhizium guizhouense ARSEF 977]